MARFEDSRAVVDGVIAAVRRACDPTTLIALHPTAVRDVSSFMDGAAVGKAAFNMVGGIGGAGRLWHGPIVVPHGQWPRVRRGSSSTPIAVAGHPLPDADSLAAGRLVASYLESRVRGDLVTDLVLLLSGGASSLIVDPPRQITLKDYRSVVDGLLCAGATITDLNTVRKHIDLLKGGWLVRRLPGVRIRVLILSDVLGDDVSIVGSGPAAPDPSTYADALATLERFECDRVGPSVSAWLRSGIAGEMPETPKPGDPDFERVTTIVVGNNETALDAAVQELDSRNIPIVQHRSGVHGESKEIGAALARKAIATKEQTLHGAIAWGGETTVTVGSAKGRGGRNQELALVAAIQIDGKPNIAIATFATDGVDGPTDAAGAVVTGETCPRARALGLDPQAALSNHDSYTFFTALDRAGFPHLIKTGPTGTNVNDLALALVY